MIFFFNFFKDSYFYPRVFHQKSFQPDLIINRDGPRNFIWGAGGWTLARLHGPAQRHAPSCYGCPAGSASRHPGSALHDMPWINTVSIASGYNRKAAVLWSHTDFLIKMTHSWTHLLIIYEPFVIFQCTQVLLQKNGFGFQKRWGVVRRTFLRVTVVKPGPWQALEESSPLNKLY